MAWTYMVSADIKAEAYRDGFNDAVKRLGETWKSALTTVWFVVFNGSAAGVLAAIGPHAGPGAEIVVIEVKKDFALTNNLDRTKAWLVQNVP